MRGINQILNVVTWIIAPTAVLLVYSQLRVSPSLPDAIRGSVAGVITLVPEGLVLLTSTALALAVIRLGRRKVLIQQLPAVEMLARTDVICLDKTGTLTERDISVARVERLSTGDDWEQALGGIAWADPQPNPSLKAIAASYPQPADWQLESTVPFSSERKWSAAKFRDRGWWVLGAPDVLLPLMDRGGELLERTSTSGARSMLLARAGTVDRQGIQGLTPEALAVLAETIRPDAAQTVRHLVGQGIAVKLISGDNAGTVAAIASRVGLPGKEAIDGPDLPGSQSELVAAAERFSIFGRVTPEQKRSVMRALKSAGHTVAMVGDGVNDVLALKEADIGIALGGGSAAARSVAACILADGSFGGLPAVLAEGRRVIGNVERLASLFFTKTVYAFVLAIAVGVAMLPFPFLPRQLTLISAFTIGIPSVFLTLAPRFQPSRADFLKSVLTFSVPSGIVAGAATFSAYALAVKAPDLSTSEERTVATMVLAGIGLWVLGRLSRPLKRSRGVLIVAMATGLVATMLAPPLRDLFAVDFPRPIVVFAVAGSVTVTVLILELVELAVTRSQRSLSSTCT
jgi:magnesium-transporting ATPase (P-type)